MKKFIVCTTIYPVTPALQLFQKIDGWDLVVVGDQKTPKDYRLDRGIYLSPAMQEEMDRDLSQAIGWNSIQRRNFGFLWAARHGADIVASVDDDNIPYAHWGKNLLLGRAIEVNNYNTGAIAFDPIGATNEKLLWHRGFPLPLLSSRDYSSRKREVIEAQVQADFWNGDPDVDTICRMAYAPQCLFDPSCFPMASNKISPFNSQNTFLTSAVLKNYFPFPHVGRMDDIWASYYLQALGAKVVYGAPSVYQARNQHDLIGDMKEEYLGYELNFKLITELQNNPSAIFNYLPKRTKEAFELYQRHFSSQQPGRIP